MGCLVTRKYLYSKMLIDFLQQKQRELSKLSIKEQLLFTLVKLKRNPSLFMLCDLFGISPGIGSNLYNMGVVSGKRIGYISSLFYY